MQNKCSLGGGNVSLTSVSENDSEAEDVEAAAETPGQAVENVQPEGSAQAAENATQETIEQEVSDPIQPTQSEAEERVYEGTDISSYITVSNGIITKYTGDFTDIVIPQSVDGEAITGIGNLVFYRHSELLSVQFPEGLESIGDQAFYDCSNLNVPTFPDSLRSIGGSAFSGCMFGKKTKAGDLIIPAAIDTIDYRAFADCSYLGSVTFTDVVDTTSLKAINLVGGTFDNCSHLTEIHLSTRVQELPAEFARKTGLTTINWTNELISIGDNAFSSTALQDCDLSGTQVTVIGDNAFSSCASLKAPVFPETLTNIKYNAFGGSALGTDKQLGELVIPVSVNSIGASAFYGCSKLGKVTFTNYEGSEIPTAITMADHYVNGVFANCENLKEIYLSNKVKALPLNFANGDKGLVTVHWSKELEIIGESAFNGCTALVDCDLSATQLTTVGALAFYECSSLKAPVFPDTLEIIKGSAFRGASLGSEKEPGELKIPSSVETIESYAFMECSALRKVTFGADNGYLDSMKLNTNIFDSCPLLTEIVFSDRIQAIPRWFASHCPKLVKLTIPSKVASIESLAFYVNTSTPISTTVVTTNSIVDSYNWAGDNRTLVKDTNIPVSVEGIILDPTLLTLISGEVFPLTATVVPANASNKKVKWSSDNTDVATVDADGKVTAISTGSAIITATTEDGGYKATCILGVITPLNDVVISASSLTVSTGQSKKLTWSAKPAGADNTSLTYAVKTQTPVEQGKTVITAQADPEQTGVLMVTGVSEGTAVIELTATDGSNTFSKTCTVSVKEKPSDAGNTGDAEQVQEGLWIAGIDAEGYSYTGSAIKPSVRVYYGNQLLRAGTEYSIAYKNNVQVGKDALIIVSGKGQYSLKHQQTFEIKACSLGEENPMVSVSAVKSSKGVSVTVTVAGKILKAAKDYQIEAADGKLTVTGIGNYKDSRTVTVRESAPVAMKTVVVSLPKMVEYTGEAITLTDAELALAEKDGTKLTIGKDYTVTYESNQNVGTATVYITGLDDGEGHDYSGTVKKTFKIVAAKFTDANIELDMDKTVAYAKGGTKPESELIWTCARTGKRWVLREGVDYKVSYKNNTKVGAAAAMTVTGLGCFKGSKLSARTYEVVLQDIATLYAYGIDKTFNEKKKGAYYMSAPVIYDVDGKKLALKKDYTVSYYNATKGEVLDKNSVVSAGDTLQVIVTGVNGYAGSFTRVEYKAVTAAKNIGSAKTDKIAAREYTGSEIELNPFPVVKLGKTETVAEGGNGYEVVAYFNNVNKGTASVLIAGTGDYSGCKLITFKINAQKWK